ncbi:MAG: N-6 DNA methylase [Armatimonadetes bacterium]|nr:N-6 DNA methylase [Armatimonadota bacterium]
MGQPVYENRSLFADNFIEHHLPGLPEWQAPDGLEAAFEAISRIYQDTRTRLLRLNEPQTEHDFIQPILDILWGEDNPGDSYQVQVTISNVDDPRQPDYGFFRSAAERQDADSRLRTIEYWRDAACVGDAKAWSASLDKERSTGENPSSQIANYLYRSRVRWGILTNGRIWRLYEREKSSAGGVFFQVDLEDILRRNDVDAFKFFFLFFRRKAFLPDADGKTFIEKVFQGSIDYATEVGDRLKESVYDALRLLMNGFFEHSANGLDRTNADDVKLVHENSLIVLYRLLFLLYAEDKKLLPIDNPVYRGHSLKRLHEEINKSLRSDRIYLPGEHRFWRELTGLFELIDGGLRDNGHTIIPAYNGGLFSPEKHPHIAHTAQPGVTRWQIGDNRLADVVDMLAYQRERWDQPGSQDIDYNSLAVQHLGSIYEGLLELQPGVASEPLIEVSIAGKSTFKLEKDVPEPKPIRHQPPRRIAENEVYLVTNRGERKATGSYYTPKYIVDYIVENTVGVLADEAAKKVAELRQDVDKEIAGLERRRKEWEKKPDRYEPEDIRRQIGGLNELIEAQKRRLLEPYLSLKILDPAMGSGHFLVGAADFLSMAMATDPNILPLDEIGDEDPQAYYKRLVVERCLYGVDLNPLAVELAKLSLWLHTVSKDKALSFLDHHLRCGNSLIGARIEEDLMQEPPRFNAKGKQVNAEDAQLILGFTQALQGYHLTSLLDLLDRISKTPTQDKESEKLKEHLYQELEAERDKFRRVANCWLSPYFGAPVTGEQYGQAVEALRDGSAWQAVAKESWFGDAQRTAGDKRFFHWELEFPEVFFDPKGLKPQDQRGFDAVIGNPPYGDILSARDKTYIQYTSGASTGGRAEVYAEFLIRTLNVLAEERHISYIIPNTLIDGAQFGAFRSRLSRESTVGTILDFRKGQVFVDADVVTMVIVLTKRVCATRYTFAYNYRDSESRSFRRTAMAVTPGNTEPWRVIDPVTQLIESKQHCVPLEPSIGTCHDAGVDYKWKGVGWQNRGTRQRLSKVLFYTGGKRHPADWPLIKGEDIKRYSKEFSGNYLIHDFAKYRTPETTVLVYLDLLSEPIKIVTRQTAERIEAAIDLSQFVTAKSIHTTIVKTPHYSPWYVLAALNSELLSYIYRLQTGEVGRAFAQVKLYDLRRLPIRRIEFTTDSEERSRLSEEAKRLYDNVLSMGTERALLDFVAEQLGQEPECSDVVHDLLAYLAKRMIEMNKKKQQEVKCFLVWLEREIGARIDALTNKSKVKEYHEHDMDIILEVLRKNAKKLAVDPSTRTFQENLRREFDHSLAVLSPLKERIAATDRLIDQIVYKLYGLSDEEIAIVEGNTPAEGDSDR